ncbi:MAG TPA: type VI secretion system contractile sheath small subunit [Crenotrichaceae bacterium]|nr:type VI secretion system contractile sheath small subunit [Crenotrichaceae bacterium]
MAKDATVAPKERINIKYVPSTGDQQQEVELPLKMVVTGDFKGHPEDTPLEDRSAINVNQQNFDSVMEETDLSASITVDDHLSGEEDATLNVDLRFKTLQDFTPDQIVQHVPELKKVMELREALVALKGPLGNVPAFRKKLQDLLADDVSRTKLASELEELLMAKPTAEKTDGETADSKPETEK